MPQLPDAVKAAWEKRNGPAIFTTVSDGSMPNSIYVTCVALYDDSTVLIADNYFDKTRRNILAGSQGSLLFMTDDQKTYQIKGTISRHTSGPMFDHMKSWNPQKHPGHAAAALAVEEVYSGAEKLL
jgi:predicted pyridoxine 5'-phosphate oxidase superfamily flavin-nucleotide-binding protein